MDLWRWRRRAGSVFVCLPPLGRSRKILGIERMARRDVWVAWESPERWAVRTAAQRGAVLARKRGRAFSGEAHVFLWHQWAGMGKEEVGGWSRLGAEGSGGEEEGEGGVEKGEDGGEAGGEGGGGEDGGEEGEGSGGVEYWARKWFQRASVSGGGFLLIGGVEKGLEGGKADLVVVLSSIGVL